MANKPAPLTYNALDLFEEVVPKKRVVDLGLYAQKGTSQTFSLAGDIELQTKEDVRSMIQQVTISAINDQIAIGNEPTQVLVDGSEAKNLSDVKRRTDTYFGDTVDQLLVVNLERTLRKMILKNTTPRTGNLSDMRNWQWVYLPVNRFGAKQPGIEIDNPRKMKRWQYGDRLLFRPGPNIVNPRDGKGYTGVVNSRVAQRGQDTTPKRGKNKGVTRTANHGFMRQTVTAMKRRAQFKGLTIYATFTTFNNANEVQWTPPGKGPFVPCIVILNRSKRTSGRGYRNRFK